MRHYFLLGFFFVFLSGLSIAQTGPAGVGTSATNVAWFKADKGMSTTVDGATVSAWNDQSGNGVHLTQATTTKMPTYKAVLMNGMPAVEFDNNTTNNDFMTAPDNTILDGTSGYTIFTVTRMKTLTGDARAIIAKRTSIDTDEAFMLFYYTSNYMHLDIDGIGNRFNTSPTAYNINTNYIFDAVYDGTLTATDRSKIYEGETMRKMSTETSATVPDKPSPLIMGATHTTDTRPFGGYVSEVMIYRVTLNDACRIIVNNYLSAKYNITLGANDKYQGDNAANGDYDRDVAGVGQESSGNNTAFSSSVSAGLGLTVNSGLNDGDYLLAGNNIVTNTATATDITVASGGPLSVRWKREWYIDVTNTSTAISANLSFDFSDAGITGVTPGTASDYKLLYRNPDSGPWTIVATASSVAGDQVNFAGYSFASNTNDGYYTIGTLDNSLSPLPIQLISFDAVLNDKVVDLDWATAAEINNAYFTVERSADGWEWSALLQLYGAGNSNAYRTYAAQDTRPLQGLSYYRLKQTNTDGENSNSAIVAVENKIQAEPGMEIFPNPSNGEGLGLLLTNFEDENVLVTIRDMEGKEYFSQKQNTVNNREIRFISFEHCLAAGTYVITVFSAENTWSKKLLIHK